MNFLSKNADSEFQGLFMKIARGTVHVYRLRANTFTNFYVMNIGHIPSNRQFQPYSVEEAMSRCEIWPVERLNAQHDAGLVMTCEEFTIPREMGYCYYIVPEEQEAYTKRTAIAHTIAYEGGDDIFIDDRYYDEVVAKAALKFGVAADFAKLCHEQYVYFGRHKGALQNFRPKPIDMRHPHEIRAQPIPPAIAPNRCATPIRPGDFAQKSDDEIRMQQHMRHQMVHAQVKRENTRDGRIDWKLGRERTREGCRNTHDELAQALLNYLQQHSPGSSLQKGTKQKKRR